MERVLLVDWCTKVVDWLPFLIDWNGRDID